MSVSPSRILVMELWGIGDVVMMSVVLKPLRVAFPNSEIVVLCQDHGREILKENRELDSFVTFKFPWTAFRGKYCFWRWDWQALGRLIRGLRARRFDLCLDARGEARNSFLAWLIGASRRVGYCFKGGGIFLTDVVATGQPARHRVEDWRGLLAYLGVSAGEAPRPVLQTTAEEEQTARAWLLSRGIGGTELLVGIHPGARIPTRRWSADRFLSVARSLRQEYGVKILVFVEPDGYGDEMAREGGFLPVKLPLREMMAVLKYTRLLVCNDGGAMHLASGLGVATVAVFGPTDPVRFAPWGPGHEIVIRKDVPCRPCFDYCSYKRPWCLEDVDADSVRTVAIKKLSDLVSREESA